MIPHPSEMWQVAFVWKDTSSADMGGAGWATENHLQQPTSFMSRQAKPLGYGRWPREDSSCQDLSILLSSDFAQAGDHVSQHDRAWKRFAYGAELHVQPRQVMTASTHSEDNADNSVAVRTVRNRIEFRSAGSFFSKILCFLF